MFDRDDYWFNRKNQKVDGTPAPLRGQGEYPPTSKLLISVGKGGKPLNAGIQKFKRENSVDRLTGRFNPKKKSIVGTVIRDLKRECWDELKRQLAPKKPMSRSRVKKALGVKA